MEDVRLSVALAQRQADERISGQSTALNNSRITVLKSRNDQLDTLFEDASKKVKELSGKKDYEKSLEALILEVCHDQSYITPPISPLGSLHI